MIDLGFCARFRLLSAVARLAVLVASTLLIRQSFGAALSYDVGYSAGPGISKRHIIVGFVDPRSQVRFVLPRGYFGGDSSGKSIQHLKIESGSTELVATKDASVWIVKHRRGGLVKISYDLMQATRGTTPKAYFYDFGENLWAVPDWDKKRPVQIRLRWSGPGLICNSYGADYTQRFTDTLEAFCHGSYLGGDIRLHRFMAVRKPITIATWGRWAFTDEQFEKVLKRLYTAEAEFWKDSGFLYTLIVLNPIDASAGNMGGEGRTCSFSLDLPQVSRLELGVKLQFAHELFHSWNPSRLRWDGERIYWFTEGFTDYYAAILLNRCGEMSRQELAEYFNTALRSYYLSPWKNAPYANLMTKRGDDYQADRMIYSRGQLIAFNWNARIREASAGRKSLGDCMRALLASAARPGFSLGEPALRQAIRPFFDSMEDMRRYAREGETIVPRPDALGPGYELREISIDTFDLGFAGESLKARVLSGVSPRGPAYLAGLRDGQKILSGGYKPGDPTSEVQLTVTDNGIKKDVKYFPKGPKIAVPQFFP